MYDYFYAASHQREWGDCLAAGLQLSAGWPRSGDVHILVKCSYNSLHLLSSGRLS